MIITNNLNLPQPFVDACNRGYRKLADNEYSVTELNNGVKEIILTRRHRDEIVVDAVDQFWAVIGTAFHSIIEKGKLAEMEISEATLQKEFTINGNTYILSGQADLYNAETKRITDWKTSMMYAIEKAKNEGPDNNWFKQQRGYWLLFNANGFECNGADIVSLARDWSVGRASVDKNYLQSPIVTIPYNFHNPDCYIDAMSFYTQKFELIDKYKDAPDDEIPACDPTDRWEKKEHWCIWREGNKRPTSYHFSKEEAEFVMESLVKKADGKGKPYYVAFYEQKPAKCMNYCRVNKFCSFYQDYVERHKDDMEGNDESME